MNGRLLVFNCHEAWVYQLRLLGLPLDIVIDLPGRHTRMWDEAMRPAPPNARFIKLHEALVSGETYDCIIGHNLSDLLDVKMLAGPRILMIHITVESLILEQRAETNPTEFRSAVAEYVRKTRTHVVPVSAFKGRSWGFLENVVLLSADAADYPAWQGDLESGLRVSNFVLRRPRYLLWDFHQRAFAGLPVKLVGHNPEIPGVEPSRSWADLKETFAHHRFFIHTADPRLEDGYNMASLEAMAAGLPVLGNRHPTSPITHGVDGFLSNDPEELRKFAQILLNDQELAGEMGKAAQRKVAERFSTEAFRSGMLAAISRAQDLYRAGVGQ